MPFVLDSSVALAWLLPDEEDERTDALADRLEHEDALVPSIWPLEVGNAMLTALRRKRISNSQFERCIAGLAALPVEVDPGAPLVVVLQLAKRCQLTSYDSAYLELSQRLRIPLATLDAGLRNACKTLKIPVLP